MDRREERREGRKRKVHTHTDTHIPFILPASSYCAWGCRDLADSAENKPPFPHLPESSEGETELNFN